MVSAAAGATGSVVCQISKIKGCRIVRIAGTEEKCRWIRDELGFDAAIKLQHGRCRPHPSAPLPDGIDIYFDNVEGETLDAAFGLLNLNARERDFRRHWMGHNTCVRLTQRQALTFTTRPPYSKGVRCRRAAGWLIALLFFVAVSAGVAWRITHMP